MSAVYAATFEMVTIQKPTVVSASMRGVVASSTPTRKSTRAAVDVPATTRTGGRWASRYVKNGARKWPTNGAQTTIATSVVVPPMRRTTTGMKATSTDANVPAQTAEKTSMRKFART